MKKEIFGYLLIVFISTCSLHSASQTSEKNLLEEKKSKIEKEIKLTNALIEETRVKKKNSITELKLLKINIVKRNQLIDELSHVIDNFNSEIEENEKLIESLRSDLEKARKEYEGLIYYAFKNNNSQLNYMYLLASESVNQFYSRYKYLQEYKEYREKQMNIIKALNRSIEYKIGDLNKRKDEKLTVINKKLTERANLQNESERTDHIVKELKQREKELLSELEKKKEIAKKLEKEIEEIIRNEAKKKKLESLSKAEKVISGDFEKNKGRFPWPIDKGVVTGKFGEHPHPVLKEIKIRNNGIDISTSKNAAVKVIFSGVVSKVFTIKGANSTVIVQHGNFFSVYHNLINVRVKAGDKVRINEIIGEVFTDAKNGESVLHFEIWKELDKLDPELWLSN